MRYLYNKQNGFKIDYFKNKPDKNHVIPGDILIRDDWSNGNIKHDTGLTEKQNGHTVMALTEGNIGFGTGPDQISRYSSLGFGPSFDKNSKVDNPDDPSQTKNKIAKNTVENLRKVIGIDKGSAKQHMKALGFGLYDPSIEYYDDHKNDTDSVWFAHETTDDGSVARLKKWYLSKKGWTYVVRPKDPKIADNIASFATGAATKNTIRYSQAHRDYLNNAAKKVDYVPSKIGDSEADCFYCL